ncbi:CRAL-TRIO domain-containing protein [Naematelia encephala]|uniref:CRAL-TRIO domain-containing protein n=1 Tax=Naematelia encephala TaxID=71784 RepID=A0A1Y2AH38_9TREE|nr:CRAL-TRIO domain-containing protein [Naematelia encephala]
MATKDPLSGHPGHLDAAQQSALEQFRKELLAEGLIPEDREAVAKRLGYDRYDDQTLLRFLRARKFDLPKSKIMWEGNEKWRKEFGTDEIAANGFHYPEQVEVNKYYPQFYHRTDRDGRPVYVEQLGYLDMNKIASLTTQDRQIRHLVHEYERFLKDRLPACSEKQGEIIETSCTIMDLNGAGISTFYRVKDYVSAASNIGQNHYPETMGFMFIINAPYLFSTIWSLIKPWLDEATVRKIHILGKGYKAELLKYIPETSLPTDLGGVCKCPGGCTTSDAGPWNPANL